MNSSSLQLPEKSKSVLVLAVLSFVCASQNRGYTSNVNAVRHYHRISTIEIIMCILLYIRPSLPPEGSLCLIYVEKTAEIFPPDLQPSSPMFFSLFCSVEWRERVMQCYG